MTLTYCGNIVRQQDSDRFLLSLFAPRACRPALWALFAFNYEIAKTRDVVSDTTLGHIRLQWWREAIGDIYDGKAVPNHEVLSALQQAIEGYGLPQALFDQLIYAREFDLEGVAPANMEGLLNYCEYTNAPLTRLALKIVGDEGNDTAVVGISTHYTLTGIIRSVSYMGDKGRIMLPQDVLEKYKLSLQKMIDFNEKEGLEKVVKEVFDAVKPYRNIAPEEISSKFLRKMRHMTKLYEAQIEKAGFDVFDPKILIPPQFFALRLWVNV